METGTISKANVLKRGEDYDLLRKQGIKNIERLAGNTWTDYNIHDPGITILEALCYAITDLSYRAGFDMKDLLAPKNLASDTWEKIFYTAKQILPCNPLTINDYRKLIVDIPGVRNAWIKKSKDYEVPIYISYEPIKTEFENILNFQKDKNFCCCDSQIRLPETYNNGTGDVKVDGLHFYDEKHTSDKIIELEGLYKIIIEYEEESKEQKTDEANLKKDKSKHPDVEQKIKDKLLSHRNLCEDFLDVIAAEPKTFTLQSHLLLKDDADADRVLAEMCFRIQNYFTPSIRFYTMEEMRTLVHEDENGNTKNGFTTEEIFEGPYLKHGFIPDFEMENSDVFHDMRLSDIINEVADIEGVIAYERFKINDDIDSKDCDAKEFFDEWMDELKAEGKVGKLDIDYIIEHVNNDNEPNPADANTPLSPFFQFKKSYGNVKINIDRFKKLLSDLKAFDTNRKLKGHTVDLPVPNGEYKDLSDYYPVQYSLPNIYAVGEDGLPSDAAPGRNYQVLQLKAYMAVFEQLLADYLSQLTNLRELFSFDTNSDNTYSVRSLLEGTLGYNPKNNTGILDYFKIYLHAENYLSDLKPIAEPETVFAWRRNKFLDHLLARFSEDMTEFEGYMKNLYPNDFEKRLIESKINALTSYPSISNDRARAFNYKWIMEDDETDDDNEEGENEPPGSPNVSGLEKRICKLLGIKNYRNRALYPKYLVFEEIVTGTDKKIIIKLYNKDNSQELLLTSEPIDSKCVDEIAHCFIECGCDGKHFVLYPEYKERNRKNMHKGNPYFFRLKNEKGIEIAHSDDFHDDAKREGAQDKKTGKEKRDEALKKTKDTLRAICENEGIHLIEHILLMPKGDDLLSSVDANGDTIDDPANTPFKLLNVCIDKCDLKNESDSKEIPTYKFDIIKLKLNECINGRQWRITLKRIVTIKVEGVKVTLEPIKLAKDFIPIFEDDFYHYEEASEFISNIRDYGSEIENFVIYKDEDSDKYFFQLVDEDGTFKTESLTCYATAPKRIGKKKIIYPAKDRKIDCGIPNVADITIEISNLKKFLAYELDLYGCPDKCANNEDPYSFRLTFVLPCWNKRFHDSGFRGFVERTIQNETPAHIHARIFWLDPVAMRDFEEPYFKWLEEIAEEDYPENDISNEFITQFVKLKNCGDPCKEDPIAKS